MEGRDGDDRMTPQDWQAYLQWRPAFADVIDETYYPIEWLDQQVIGGNAIFVCTDKAAALYEIKEYPSGAKDIHGLVCCGDLVHIVERLIPVAREHGRSLGCVGFLVESRPGWAKALKPQGFKVFQVSVRAKIHGAE